MKKPAFLLLALASLIFAAVPFRAEAEGRPLKEITVERTPAHGRIFPIPVYVKLIPGFSFRKTGNGCVDPVKKVSFEASEVRVPYGELQRELTGENLGRNGLYLKNRTEFIWNGARVLLLKIFQDGKKATMAKWTLVIDRDELCWMISGHYNAGDQKRGGQVLEMIKSVCWSEKEVARQNTLAMLPPVSATPFRAAGISDGAYVYTKDGRLPTQSGDGAFIAVSKIPNAFVSAAKRLEYAKRHIEEIMPGEKLAMASEKTFSAGNMNGNELTAYTGGSGRSFIFQAMLFDYRDCYVAVGVSRDNDIENLEYFRRILEELWGKRVSG